MKNWKKCVALLLAILMLSALFTGCAKTATETPNESEQPAADNADAVKAACRGCSTRRRAGHDQDHGEL